MTNWERTQWSKTCSYQNGECYRRIAKCQGKPSTWNGWFISYVTVCWWGNGHPKGESHSIKRLNEVLANQSQFFKDQILSKDEVIRSLLGGSQSPTLPKAAQGSLVAERESDYQRKTSLACRW